MSESLRDLVVSLSLDSDNFSRNIKSIQQQIKEAESGFRAAGAGVNGFENTISGAQAKLATLEQKFQLQQQAVQQYERALTAAQGKLEKSAQTQDKLSQKLEAAKQHHAELADRIDQLKQSMQDLNDEGQSGTAAYAEMQAELEALQAEYAANGQEVSKLEQQLSRNAATMQRNADAVTRAQTNLNNVNAGLRETQNQIAQVRSYLEQLQNVLVNAGNKLVQFGDQAKNIGSAIEGVGKKMSVLSAAVTAAGTKSVQTFTSYDDAIRQVYATMGLSVEENAAQMAALDAAAQEMGKNTKYHAMEAAEALNYLALAGYDADKAIATLPRVLSLAQAGGMDLATASDMVTDNMSALGIATNHVEQFIDQMAVTAQKSNTSVAQLGEGVQAVSGAAKNLKGGTIELNTALGVMADNGIKGAEGGKHLRNVILSLQSPTKEAAEQLAAMKIQVYDAAGNMRGLDEIFSDMSASMEGWTQQAKDQAISKIFNKTDLTAVNALISNCGARWQELSGYIAESDGAAQKMGETMEGGIGGSFRSLSSAVESLGIKFGETLAPTVQAVADKITDLVRRFSELDESSKQRIVTIAAGVAAAGPAVLIIGKITSGIGTMIGAFGKGMIAISKIPKLISSTTTTIAAFGSKAAGTFKTFQRTASEAGGGMQGFLTALKGSPTLMAAAAAACGYLVYKFIDFVSGAKAAREAQARLNATVKEWNEDVTTAFEKADGLSAFQLSADDFKVDGADSVK